MTKLAWGVYTPAPCCPTILVYLLISYGHEKKALMQCQLGMN